MSFYETEALDGVTPAELVTFSRGRGPTARVWRYSTLDRDVTYNGVTYAASSLTRGKVFREQSSGRDSCDITIASALPFMQDWLASDASVIRTVTAVTVLRVHVTANAVVIDPSGEPVICVFVGNVLGAEMDGATTTLRCASLTSQLASQTIPRIPIARTCPWSVYDFRCGVDPADIDSSGTVSAVGSVTTGTIASLLGGAPTVTLAMSGSEPLLVGVDPDPERFNGGVLLYVDGGVTRRITVLATVSYVWSALVLVLDAPLPSGAVSATVALWPGCQKTETVCTQRFSNVRHFGGFARLPDRNPLIQGLR